jgi:isopenicillin N synthase-like dioxygenase
VNHGVEAEAMQQIKDSVAQFFSLPLEAKNTVAVRGGTQGFGHHFSGGASTDKLDWAECLLLFTRPLQARNMDAFWPTNPPTFRCVHCSD